MSKEVDNSPAAAATEDANPDEQSKDDCIHPDLFDENFKELKKWVDVKCTKYGILLVTHEKRSQRTGTALKVFSFSKSCCYRIICSLSLLFFFLVSESVSILMIKDYW